MDIDQGWMKRYQPASRLTWRGRIDEAHPTRIHEITKFIDLRECIPSANPPRSFAFIGFSCDAGIRRNFGRSGAATGPDACKEALSNVPISAVKGASLYDFGQIDCSDGHLEEAQEALSEIVALALRKGFHPIVIGGGHETAWGHYLGISKALKAKPLSIVNFDAHFDLRPLLKGGLGSSGTPFTQIRDYCEEKKLAFDYHVLGIQRLSNTPKLFERADKLGVRYTFADDIHFQGAQLALDHLDAVLAEQDNLYLTLDLDVIATAFSPGVSAPQPLGLSPWQVIPLLKHLAKSGKVVSLDVCELSPYHDHDGTTAQLAASLLAIYMANIKENDTQNA